jgi:hypothetical protein
MTTFTEGNLETILTLLQYHRRDLEGLGEDDAYVSDVVIVDSEGNLLGTLTTNGDSSYNFEVGA